MRHLPTDMVESNATGTGAKNPVTALKAPSQGQKTSRRPYQRRKYQTRGVLRYAEIKEIVKVTETSEIAENAGINEIADIAEIAEITEIHEITEMKEIAIQQFS